MFNLNNADTTNDLIPDGTVVRAVLTIRPGGHGDGGWCKQARSGALMLDTEWTITEGKFAKRKVWNNMMVTGNDTAVGITMRQLRAAIEGHFGIKPDDMSPEAQAKRNVTIEQLNGIEAVIQIGIEKSEGYADKNTVKNVIPPGDTRFVAKGQGGDAPATSGAASFSAPAGFSGAAAASSGGFSAPQTTPMSGGGNRPAWAS